MFHVRARTYGWFSEFFKWDRKNPKVGSYLYSNLEDFSHAILRRYKSQLGLYSTLYYSTHLTALSLRHYLPWDSFKPQGNSFQTHILYTLFWCSINSVLQRSIFLNLSPSYRRYLLHSWNSEYSTVRSTQNAIFQCFMKYSWASKNREPTLLFLHSTH